MLFGFYSKFQKETTDLVTMWIKDLNDTGRQEAFPTFYHGARVLVMRWPVYTSLPFFMQKPDKGGMDHGL